MNLPDGWTLISTLGTLIFGVLTIVFYFRSKRFKRPIFVYDYSLLQTRVHQDIKIYFKDEQVENLSRSHILFLNNGNKEIRKEDIPKDGYPFIEFHEGVRLLSQGIVATSNNSIGFRTKLSKENHIQLEFEYLNAGDGAVVEVLYENNTKHSFPATCRAPLIGVTRERVIRYIQQPPVLVSVIFSVLIGIMILLGISLITKSITNPSWHGISMGTATILVSVFAIWGLVIIPIRKRVPGFATAVFEYKRHNK